MTSSFNTHVTYAAITLLLAVECLCVPVPALLSVRVIANATVPTLHALEGLLPPLAVLYSKSTVKYPQVGIYGCTSPQKAQSSSKEQGCAWLPRPAEARWTCHLLCLSFLRQEAKPVSEAQTDILFRKDCTPGISGISAVAGCSIYALVMSGQMGHAAPADCWAGCHWESRIRDADTLGTPLFVQTTKRKLSDVHKQRGMARGSQQLFPLCLPASGAGWCRPSLFPRILEFFEPKSSTPQNHGLSVGAGSWDWDAARSGGSRASHRQAAWLLTGTLRWHGQEPPRRLRE